MDNSKQIGELGERVAEEYLVQNNYTIIEKNYRCNFGEIDIIAKYKNILIFIEVKARTNEVFGDGICSIDITKQKHIYKTVEYYLYGKNLKNIDIRIDAIEIFLNPDKIYLNHYQDIIMEKPYYRRRI